MSEPHPVEEAVARVTKALVKLEPLLAQPMHHLNHPLRDHPGKRVVGFALPEDVAGLSDGLFMVDAIRDVLLAAPALLSALERQKEALEGCSGPDGPSGPASGGKPPLDDGTGAA